MRVHRNDGDGSSFVGHARHRRSVGALVAFVAILAGLLSSGPLAGASSGPTFKFYTANVLPKAVLESNTPTQVTLNLANETISNTSFGSAEVTVPDAFANGQPVTVPRGWTAGYLSTNPDVLLLTSVKSAVIAPGGTLPVTFTFTPSTTTNGSPYNFVTEVKQSNNFSGTGNDFNLDSANSGTTIEVVSTANIAFDQQPTDVQQSTSTSYFMCPAVSVIATASDGTPVGGVTVTVSHNSATGDPGLIYSPESLSSPGVTTDDTGVATFATFGSADCSSGIGATNLGSGYTLIANATTLSGTITSPESSTFSVVQMLFTCTTDPCNTPTITGASGTKGSASISFGTPGYKVIGQFGGNSLVCDSEVTTIPADELDLQTTVGASGVVTLVFPKSVVNNLANNGTPLMQVCAGASAQFPGSKDQGQGVTPEWQGLAADCGTGYTSIPDNICVLSRSKNAASETIKVYVQNLSDPGFW